MNKLLVFFILVFSILNRTNAQTVDTVYFGADHYEIEKELKAFATEFEIRKFKSKNNRTGTVERHNIYGGKISEYTMLNNAPTGPYIHYYPNGNVRAKGNWWNGQERGISEQWYDNGQKMSIREVIEVSGMGFRSTLREAWDRDGNLMVTKGNGLFEERIEKTGVLRYGNYKDGFMYGVWTDEGPDGKVQSISEYGEYGKLEWSQKGDQTVESARAEVIAQPQFPGGPGLWSKHLKKNLKYPRAAMIAGAQGFVEITFLVRSDGSLTDIRVTRQLHPSADDEARRVIRLSPNWIPAQENGVYVDREMTTRIYFKMK